MPGLFERGDFEDELEALPRRDRERFRKTLVRDRPAEECGGQGQVDALLAIGRGVGARRVEGERGPGRLLAEERADETPDVMGPGRVRARRPAHDRP
jgi:hypothetical protein